MSGRFGKLALDAGEKEPKKQVNLALVESYARRIEHNLGKQQFWGVMQDLRQDKQMGIPEFSELVSSYAMGSSRSKADAIRKLEKMQQQRHLKDESARSRIAILGE